MIFCLAPSAIVVENLDGDIMKSSPISESGGSGGKPYSPWGHVLLNTSMCNKFVSKG